MIVYIDCDELYPCYTMRDKGYSLSKKVKVSRKTLESWRKIEEDFFKLQRKLRKHYEKEVQS